MRPLQFGRKWAEVEDAKLSDYVSRNGTGKWNAVAAHIGTGRTPGSCRQRWLEFHCSSVRKGEFTPEEKLTTLLLHSKCRKNSWSKIAEHLPGRTSNQIKNYYNKIVKKKATDFPVGNIKRLVKAIEAQGKNIPSCLAPTAYNGLTRLTIESPPATTSAAIVDDFDHIIMALDITFDDGIPNFTESPHLPMPIGFDPDQPLITSPLNLDDLDLHLQMIEESIGFDPDQPLITSPLNLDDLDPHLQMIHEDSIPPITGPFNLDHLDLFKELDDQELGFPSRPDP